MSNDPRSPRAHRAQATRPDPLRRFRNRADILRKELVSDDPGVASRAAALLVGLPTLPDANSVEGVLRMVRGAQVQRKHLLDVAAREAEIPGVRSWADLQPRVARDANGARWTVRPDLPYCCLVCDQTKYALDEMVARMRERLAGKRHRGSASGWDAHRLPLDPATMTDTDIVGTFTRCPACTDGPDDAFALAPVPVHHGPRHVPRAAGRVDGPGLPVQRTIDEFTRWGAHAFPAELLPDVPEDPTAPQPLIKVYPFPMGPAPAMHAVMARLTLSGNRTAGIRTRLTLDFPAAPGPMREEATRFALEVLRVLTERERPRTVAGLQATGGLEGRRTLVLTSAPDPAVYTGADALSLLAWARNAMQEAAHATAIASLRHALSVLPTAPTLQPWAQRLPRQMQLVFDDYMSTPAAHAVAAEAQPDDLQAWIRAHVIAGEVPVADASSAELLSINEALRDESVALTTSVVLSGIAQFHPSAEVRSHAMKEFAAFPFR